MFMPSYRERPIDSSLRTLPSNGTPAAKNAASSGRKKPHDDAEQTGTPLPGVVEMSPLSVRLRVVMFAGLMGMRGSTLMVLFSCKLSTWTYSASITVFEVIDQVRVDSSSQLTAIKLKRL